jgi:hypothetical protein
MKYLISIFVLIGAVRFSATAQTTEFTYQGNLKDGASAANGNYDIQFSLFAIDTGGSAIGTLQKMAVPVANGSFTVKLDFGAQFPGAVRYLELAVRPAGVGSFTTLAPRQQISNAPYAVRSLNAANADNATTATNATNASNAATATNSQQLGGLAANQYVVTSDARLSDQRSPTAGSTNYIQNATSQQPASNFNISGDGTAGGTLTGSIVNSSQFNIGGNRVLGSNANFANVSVGFFSGDPNALLQNDSFFGSASGQNNTGNFNSFFGTGSGGFRNTGSSDSFFGNGSGARNTTGNFNSFYGDGSGSNNTTGNENLFFGENTGATNTTGSDNTIIGSRANVGAANLTNATAIGANASVSSSNSLVLGSGVNVGIGTPAPSFKLQVTDAANTGLRVQTNTTGGTVASFGGNGVFQIDGFGFNGGRFSVLENGNTGIGIATPSSKLQVNNGDIRVTGGAVIIANPGTVIITSPNGACWGITVNNSGVLSTFPVSPCP